VRDRFGVGKRFSHVVTPIWQEKPTWKGRIWSDVYHMELDKSDNIEGAHCLWAESLNDLQVEGRGAQALKALGNTVVSTTAANRRTEYLGVADRRDPLAQGTNATQKR
jgi:hypothetical protein